MLIPRVIPCLLLSDGGLVKTVKFKNPKYIGDPINAVKIYNEKEVDELIFIDIDASRKGLEPNYSVIKDLATECFMPFSYGGGITSIEQIQKILSIGVEKVVLNHCCLSDLTLVREAAVRFGNSTLVGAVDITVDIFGKRKLYDHVKKAIHKTDLFTHIRNLEEAGVGELFLNFVQRDGTYSGYDLETVKKITSLTNVPVIICGGASSTSDFKSAIEQGNVSAVSAGSVFVYHGPHKAVLISYPSQAELKELFK